MKEIDQYIAGHAEVSVRADGDWRLTLRVVDAVMMADDRSLAACSWRRLLRDLGPDNAV